MCGLKFISTKYAVYMAMMPDLPHTEKATASALASFDLALPIIGRFAFCQHM